jgi:hypothetical protein
MRRFLPYRENSILERSLRTFLSFIGLRFARGVNEAFGLLWIVGFGCSFWFHNRNPIMTAGSTEADIAHLIVQVFAEHLRDWEARRQIAQDQVGIGVSRIIPDAINLTSSLSEEIRDLHPRNDPLIDKGLNEGGQQRIAGDGHSKV